MTMSDVLNDTLLKEALTKAAEKLSALQTTTKEDVFVAAPTAAAFTPTAARRRVLPATASRPAVTPLAENVQGRFSTCL